jgi:hypothetical protein
MFAAFVSEEIDQCPAAFFILGSGSFSVRIKPGE